MEASFSPPNLKRIGYPKNTIYMKCKNCGLEIEYDDYHKRWYHTPNLYPYVRCRLPIRLAEPYKLKEVK